MWRTRNTTQLLDATTDLWYCIWYIMFLIFMIYDLKMMMMWWWSGFQFYYARNTTLTLGFVAMFWIAYRYLICIAALPLKMSAVCLINLALYTYAVAFRILDYASLFYLATAAKMSWSSWLRIISLIKIFVISIPHSWTCLATNLPSYSVT